MARTKHTTTTTTGPDTTLAEAQQEPTVLTPPTDGMTPPAEFVGDHVPAGAVLVSARFVVLLSPEFGEDERLRNALASFERALDEHSELLRRTTQPDHRADQRVVELRCNIEYGPTRRLSMPQLERSLAVSVKDALNSVGDYALFDVVSRELTADALHQLRTDLMQAADDLALPLAIRQQRSRLAAKLTRCIDDRPRQATNVTKVDWVRDPYLSVIKMLAWTIKKHERLRTERLWARVDALSEQIIEAVLGNRGVTLTTLREQHPEITPARLTGRAESAERNGEFTKHRDAVERAYQQITSRHTSAERVAPMSS